MAQLAGYEILAKCLKAQGAKDLFFIMGGPMLDAELSCIEEGIRLIDTRHEQNACHMAEAWALTTRQVGVCALTDANLSRRSWAASLFSEAMPAAEGFRSPRAWAFVLLGLDAYCTAVADDLRAIRLRALLADRLMSIFDTVASDDDLMGRGARCYRKVFLKRPGNSPPCKRNLIA